MHILDSSMKYKILEIMEIVIIKLSMYTIHARAYIHKWFNIRNYARISYFDYKEFDENIKFHIYVSSYIRIKNLFLSE